VTPQQTETLTISAAPALGSQAVAAPVPTATGTTEMKLTKKTETTETTYPSPSPENGTPPTPTPSPPITRKSITEEKTLPTPTPRTIYDLYQHFADHCLETRPTRPGKNEYVPGTLKRWEDAQYYYIPAEGCPDCKKQFKNEQPKNNNEAYYYFCKALFTKGQAASLETALRQTQAAAVAPQ
jgi:hypothetical protein